MAAAIASPSACHSPVEPSTSVNKNPTVPAGNTNDPADPDPVTAGSPHHTANPLRHSSTDMIPGISAPTTSKHRPDG